MNYLSKKDCELIEGRGFSQPVGSALLDLAADGSLHLTKLILCDHVLIIADAKKVASTEFFGACGEMLPDIDEGGRFEIIERDSITGGEVLKAVSGGALCLKTSSGDRLLGGVTNTYIEPLRVLLRLIDRRYAQQPFDRQEGRPPLVRPSMGPPMGPPPEDNQPKKSFGDSRRLIIRIARFFLPYEWHLAVALIFTLLTAALDLITPYLSGTVLFGRVLDGSPADGMTAALLTVVLAMLAAKLCGLAFGAVKDAAVASAVPWVVRDIKSQVFAALDRLPLSFYLSRETGGLMTRVLSDADQITSLFIDNLPTVFIDVITVIGAASALFIINPYIAVVALIAAPLTALLTSRIMPRLSVMHSRRHRAERSINSHVNDNLTGARVIKAFGREQEESARFEHNNSSMKQAEVDIVTAESKMHSVFQLTGSLGTSLIYGIGALIMLSSVTDLDYSSLISVSMYVGMLSGPLGDIARLMQQWARSMNSARRIFEIIDCESTLTETEHPAAIKNLRGDIRLEGVRFSYNKGEPVLEDISFNIPAGKTLGIVGRSGSGKSTLVNLISRLYDPDEGQILIDGVDIREMSFDDIHRTLAMVSQETYIFMGTVAENIAYAKPGATRDEIVAAAVAAGAHSFICKLPDGYDTVIGTSGRELSGGERQRISIARAVLTDPVILILDEATAAVDTQTELAIQRSLDRLCEGRTTISIAHRLSTLNSADSLIVIENGRIVERGTHAELTAAKGLFYRLSEIQRQALMMKGIEH